jgi:hypothetical protein
MYMYMYNNYDTSYLLSNLDHVSSREDIQVRSQGTTLEGLAVSHVVRLLPKENIIFQRGILDPGLLRDIRHTTLKGNKHDIECAYYI